jgi:hypothetical protein
MNRFLKGADRMDLIDEPARKLHPPRDLKVFAELPADEKVTTVDEFFVPTFIAPPVPSTAGEWAKWRDATMEALRRDCFRAWPADRGDAVPVKKSEQVAEGLRLTVCEFTSEEPFVLPLWLVHRDGLKPEELEDIVLDALDEEEWNAIREHGQSPFPAQIPAGFVSERESLLKRKFAIAYFCPRGVGAQSVAKLPQRKLTHLRRRLLLLGESLESGQVWDIVQAAAAVRMLPGMAYVPLRLRGEKDMAANVLYGSLFIPEVTHIDLIEPVSSHRDGAGYLNILRHLDLPQAAALAAERSNLLIMAKDTAPWDYARAVSRGLHWRGEVFGGERVGVARLVAHPSPESR